MKNKEIRMQMGQLGKSKKADVKVKLFSAIEHKYKFLNRNFQTTTNRGAQLHAIHPRTVLNIKPTRN